MNTTFYKGLLIDTEEGPLKELQESWKKIESLLQNSKLFDQKDLLKLSRRKIDDLH